MWGEIEIACERSRGHSFCLINFKLGQNDDLDKSGFCVSKSRSQGQNEVLDKFSVKFESESCGVKM